MQTNNLPYTHFSSLEKDFRAEVTGAEMMELGVSADNIVIIMVGALKRTFQKDILSIEEESSGFDDSEYIVIKTPREGFYDMLPEGLFHLPSAHKTAATQKEISKAIKRRKEEEQQARTFFLPFEAGVNHIRIQLAHYENRLDKRSSYDELVRIFATQWSIFDYLDSRQADLFLYLIPILHLLRDDYPAVETVLEMMLQLPVRIQLRPRDSFHDDEPILSTMGDSFLGVNLTTGSQGLDEGLNEILITIGPLTNKTFQRFLPGESKHKLLQLLIDYLLPVHMEVVTKFELHEDDKITKFASDDSWLNSILGADTYL